MPDPHFIIAGERRSGSTTLYDVLRQHPEVGMLDQTDFDYFIEPELFSRGPLADGVQLKSWEESHSRADYQAFFKNLKGVLGQKDADLLWWKPAHERLARYLPDTKFVFVLRDPVKRAESQYFNELGKGRETASFGEALEREENRPLSSWETLHLQYKARGCYVESLRHFYKYIPRERVKVIILEELMKNWEEEFSKLCAFIGIDTSLSGEIKPIHSNKEELLVRKNYARSAPLCYLFAAWDRVTEALIVRLKKNKRDRDRWRHRLRGFYYTSARKERTTDPEIRTQLAQFYLPYQSALEELLNRKINCW